MKKVSANKVNTASTSQILGIISYNSDTSYGDNGSWTAHAEYGWDALGGDWAPDKDRTEESCGSCHSWDGGGFNTDYSDVGQSQGGEGENDGGW